MINNNLIINTHYLLQSTNIYISVVGMFTSIYYTAKWMDGPIKRLLTDEAKVDSINCRVAVSFFIVNYYLFFGDLKDVS